MRDDVAPQAPRQVEASRVASLPRNFPGMPALKESSAPVEPEQDADVQLMLAVQRGDMTAFRQLFDKHITGVIGFATQFVGARARAEELAQDVFLQIYRTRARYVPRARFKTWLYRIVTNACLSELRRPDYQDRRVSPNHEVQAGDQWASAAEAVERSTEESAIGREAVIHMRDALTQLPATQRAALLLARVEGLSYEEVANALSCTVAAVKSLVHRATVTLRERLDDNEV